MKRHIRAHIGDRPYGCEYCRYRSNQKANLLSHVRIKHSNQHKARQRPRYLLTEDGIQETTDGGLSPVKTITFKTIRKKSKARAVRVKNIRVQEQRIEILSPSSDQENIDE
uniref:Zinc finger protein 64 homolog, isoforms 1 and 2 n=3 Tax=Cacopsylla melanoneura TaxID=428564 RepID=A0A8D9DZX3_9HEMI